MFSNILYLLQFINNFYYKIAICIGFILIIIGFFIKLGVAPFHAWVVDVYDGSSYIIVYFLSTLPKVIIISFIFNFMIIFVHNYDNYIFVDCVRILLQICGVLSIFFGSIGALYQIKIKRMLALSSVANIGYLLLGLSCFSFLGYASTVYFLIIYVCNLTGVFIIFICLHNVKNAKEIKNVDELASVAHWNYFLVIVLVFNLFSLAGIPPLSGFFAKLAVFYTLCDKYYYFLLLYCLIFSVLTSVYYLS